MSLALYRKYRPQTFADVTDQAHVKTALQNQIKRGTLSHAFLFTGPRGVGKTTLARLLAKLINCQNERVKKTAEPCNACASCTEIAAAASLDVIEMDAASHTGVDHVREFVIDAARMTPTRGRYKVFIIDEVHMLSTSAFNALLKTLEEPPAHAVFVLATTEIQKVPETIVSRTQRYDFHRVLLASIVTRLEEITKAEKVEVDADVLGAIARHSDGCLRDAESLLGQVLALGGKKIGPEEASLVLPMHVTQTVLSFIEALARRDAVEGLRLIRTAAEQGIDPGFFLTELMEMLRLLLQTTLGASAALAEAYAPAICERLVALSLSATDLTRLLDEAATTRRTIGSDAIPYLGVELLCVRFCLEATPQDFQQKGVDSGYPNVGVDLRVHPVSDGQMQRSAPTKVLESATVIFDSVPVIDIEEVREKWPEVFKQLQETHATLPLVIQTGEISGVSGREVELAFDYELHAQTVNREKNRRVIDQIVEKVFGRTLHIKAIHAPTKPDEVVSEVLDAFGGKVV